MSCPPVTMAMSCSMALRRSPKPDHVHRRLGAFGLLDGHRTFRADFLNRPGDELANRGIVMSRDRGDLLLLAFALDRP